MAIPYKHLKTGNVYYVTHENVLLATNNSPDEGKPHVLYLNQAGDYFVREAQEFEQKFQRLEAKGA
jgi:hypothetical protein